MFTNTITYALRCYPWKQLYLIAFVDLVPAGSRKGQSYPVEYYLESVEEYSEGKIHKSKPEPGRIFSTKFKDCCKCFSSIKLNWRRHAT